MTAPRDFLAGVGEQTAEHLSRLFGPDATAGVFTPVTDDAGNMVITAAAFERVGGFGWGGGAGTDADGDEGAGGGGGGGGVTEGRPVAVIRVGESGVQVTPVLDLTKITVTFLVSAAAVWRALR